MTAAETQWARLTGQPIALLPATCPPSDPVVSKEHGCAFVTKGGIRCIREAHPDCTNHRILIQYRSESK